MATRAAPAGTILRDACSASAARPDGVAESHTCPQVIVSSDFPPSNVIPVRGIRAGDPPEQCRDPADDNRRPFGRLNGDRSKRPVLLTVRSGETVTRSSKGSRDPDGDALEASWWIETHVDSQRGAILSTGAGPTTQLILADGAAPQMEHVVRQARDNGSPHWCGLPPRHHPRRALIQERTTCNEMP